MRITIAPLDAPTSMIVLNDPGQRGRDVWQSSDRTLDGWLGLPSAQRGINPQPGMDGGWMPTRTDRVARAITLDGWADLTGMPAGWAMIKAMERTIQPGRPAIITATEPDGVARSRTVMINAIEIDTRGLPHWLDWVIECEAADTRRYGPIQFPTPLDSATLGYNYVHNGGFRSSAAGWWGQSLGPSPLAVQRVAFAFDLGAGQVVAPAGGTPGLGIATRVPLPSGTAPVPELSADVRTSAGRLVHFTLTWLDSQDRIVEVQKLPGRQTVAGQWTSFRHTISRHTGATAVVLAVDGLDSGPWAAGSSLAVANVLLGKRDADQGWADGNSPGWEWTGTPNASGSRAEGMTWLLDNYAGTAPSEPRMRIQVGASPLPNGFRLGVVDSGMDRLTWPYPIPANAVVDIIPGEHIILINDQLPTSPQPRGPWPVVPPGERWRLVLNADQALMTATTQFATAWW